MKEPKNLEDPINKTLNFQYEVLGMISSIKYILPSFYALKQLLKRDYFFGYVPWSVLLLF